MPDRGTRRSLEKYLPLTYFVLALLLAFLVLPSILRQRPPQPSQTAELSPDAPPNPDTPSIIANLNRGSSATAGASGTGTGPGEGTGLGGGGGGDGGGPGGVAAAPRSCPHGFGNPARQTFSLYAAQCALAWSGDNGGATAPGVDANEIRLAVGYPAGNVGTNGRVSPTWNDSQSSQDRTWSVLQAWLNQNYQLYGRRIQLYVVNINTDDNAQQSAIAAQAASYRIFGSVMGRLGTVKELARRHIIVFGEFSDQYSDPFLNGLAPYAWQWKSSTTWLSRASAEYVCKKLYNKPTAYSGDPLLQGKPRVLGLIYNDNEGVGAVDGEMRNALREQCGATLAASIGFHSDQFAATSDRSTMASAVSQLRNAGVTTVVDALDADTTAFLSAEASGQDYVPEWFLTGRSIQDNLFWARLHDQREWAHAFGISTQEVDPTDSAYNLEYTDAFVAYHQMDATGSPDGVIANNLFPILEQLVNGIQLAGPHLTPQTFQSGLWSMPRRAPVPSWSIGGGWGPNRHYYMQDPVELWWDPTAIGADGAPASFRWTHKGARWTVGSGNDDVSELFHDGITERTQAQG